MRIADVPAAILAGGLATRLGPVTAQTPKALVDVAGRPFIDHQLSLLRRRGVRRVVLCLAHMGQRIAEHVGDGRRYGLDVRVSLDGPRLLGTGGALVRALPQLDEAFFVFYGDSLTDIELDPLLQALTPDAEAVMAVLENGGRWDASNVLYEQGLLQRYDKRAPTPDMRHIDYGVGLLKSRAFRRLPRDEPSDLADLYAALSAEGRLKGVLVSRRFYEIGSAAGLEETRLFALEQQRMNYVDDYLSEAVQVIAGLDRSAIQGLVDKLLDLRQRQGRLFILGVGGSAGNASHAVNDFRKICGIEAYAPTDNVSELTARVNDDGWETVFASWLRTSRLEARDALLVFSVGGGDLQRNVSPNLVRALDVGRERGATILGIVGRDGGYTAQVADVCVIVPTVNAATVTPHAEAFQGVVWHLLVSHPALQANAMKWESTR